MTSDQSISLSDNTERKRVTFERVTLSWDDLFELREYDRLRGGMSSTDRIPRNIGKWRRVHEWQVGE